MSLSYVGILCARGVGAHRQVHYEDAIAIASIRSQGLWSSLDDVGYGTVLQQSLVRVVAALPIELWPLGLFAAATTVWLACALTVATAARRAGAGWIAAWIAGAWVVLVPVPEIAGQGRTMNILWPLLVAAAVPICLEVMPRSTAARRGAAAAVAVVAASSPAMVALIPIVGWRWFLRRHSDAARWTLAIVAGAGISLVINASQDAALSYLGSWRPDSAYEAAVLERLADAGATENRLAAVTSPGDVLAAVPGSAKYVAATFVPEPWQSDWILINSAQGNLWRLVLIVGVLALPWIAGRGRGAVRGTRVLLLAACLTVVVPLMLNGSVQSRQYVIAPLILYGVSAILRIGSMGWYRAVPQPVTAGILVMAVFIPLSLVQVRYYFRDPFRTNNHAGIAGTYAPANNWQDGLSRSRMECREQRDPEAVVVIRQYLVKSPNADFPMLLRCGVLD